MESDSETSYINELKSYEWINLTQYVDIEKIKQNIPSFQYLIDNIKKLENYCTEKVFKHIMSKDNLSKSQGAKELARKGIPPKYLREFLLKYIINNNNDEYSYLRNKSLHNFSVEDLDNYIPFFTGKHSLEESLPVHYLNDNGIKALKEILWILHIEIGNIEFSPNIIGISSILLIFLNKEETLKFMLELIKINFSNTKIGAIRFHFRFTFDDNHKIISSIKETMSDLSKKNGKATNDHLNNIKLAPEIFYEDIVFNTFLKHLNFFGILRFLPFYIMEGCKSMYRLVYALVKKSKDKLLAINDSAMFLKEAVQIMGKIENYDELFNLSYSYGLTHNNNKYLFQNNPDISKRVERYGYYIPEIDKDSGILSKHDIISLWSKLPPEINTRNLIKVYDSNQDGICIENIIATKSKINEGNCIIMIISTSNDEVFGLITSNPIDYTNGTFVRPNLSILFNKEKGNISLYYPEPNSEQVIYVSSDCLMIGNGSNGPAIRVDSDFYNGISYEKGCFNSPCLSNSPEGKFYVKRVEIYEFIFS